MRIDIPFHMFKRSYSDLYSITEARDSWRKPIIIFHHLRWVIYDDRFVSLRWHMKTEYHCEFGPAMRYYRRSVASVFYLDDKAYTWEEWLKSINEILEGKR